MRIILKKTIALLLTVLILSSIFVPAVAASAAKSKPNSNNDSSNATNGSFSFVTNNNTGNPENLNVPATTASPEANPLEENNNGKSQDNTKDIITDVPETSESPLALKTHAIDEVSALSASVEDAKKVAEIIEHLKRSIESNFWDDYHIKSGEAFKEDKQAAQKIRVLFDREKKSDLNKEALLLCLTMLLQADSKLSDKSIADAKSALLYLTDPTIVEKMGKEIEKAEKEYAKAEEHIKKGDPVVAIEFFGKAWEHANAAIYIADRNTTPKVILSTPKDSTYTNISEQTVTGSVDDVALYTIKNASLTVNGATSEIPLTEGKFSQKVTLVEGMNSIQVAVKDAFGNEGTVAASITLDAIAPSITITGVENGKYYNRDVLPDIKVYDVNLQSSSILLDGVSYSGEPINKEGVHALEVYAADLAGNSAYKKVKFTIDRTPPKVEVINPSNNSYLRKTVEIKGSVTDINLDIVSLKIDDVEVSTSASYPWDTTKYADGVHTIELYAKDKAENKASIILSVTVDNTPPSVVLTNPSNNSYLRQLLNIEGSATDDNLASTSLRINGQEVSTSLPYPWDTRNYGDGKYSIELFALDLAGNSASVSISATVDNTPPRIIIRSPLANAYLRQETKIDADVIEVNLERVYVEINGSEVSTNVPYIWSTLGYPDNLYGIEVSAKDKAGNEAAESLSITVDNTPPTVSFLYPLNNSFLSLKSLSLLWSGNDNYGISIYELFLDNHLFDRTAGTSKALEALEDRRYESLVQAYDLANNSASDTIRFTIDTIPPVIEITGVGEGKYYNTSVKPQINITEINLNFTEITLNGVPYNEEIVNDERAYSLKIYAEDLAGNNAKRVINFTIDKTPPAVNLIDPVENAYLRQTVDITGTVADVNLALKSLRINGQEVSTSLPYSWDTKTYADGEYLIELITSDLAGNSASVSRTVTIDNMLPVVSIVEPLEGAFVKSIVSIKGTVGDANIDTISLKIDGSAVSSSLPYEWDTSGYKDGIHTIELSATDKAGNGASITRQVTVDNTPPVVILTAPVKDSYLGKIVSIEGSTSDSNLNRTSLYIDNAEVSSSLPYSWDTSSYPGGAHTLRLSASDMAGNIASVEIAVTIDNTAPIASIISPLDGALLRQTVEINSTITEINIHSINLTIDGAKVADGMPYLWDTQSFADGSHSIELTVIDKANNYATAYIEVTTDNTPPALTVNELTDNPTLESPAYRINGTVEVGSTLVINSNTISHSGSFEYATIVNEGTNTITVTATDAAGNTAIWTKTRLVDNDNLPDYYEINVTGTDPLNGDSDSNKTPQNEAGNGIKDDMEFLGSGELPSVISMRIGANPLVQDTDGDGLTDKFELLKLGLLTNVSSSSTNGASDASADLDKDGLTNIEEQNYGTDPLVPDTDKDGISDKDEITAGTNPLVKDTDGDGLDDDSELRLGTNPNKSDSDGDGIPDGFESYSNQRVNGEIATVLIDGVGDVSKTTNISNASGYVALANMPGSIGRVVDINTTSAFTSATISIPYNESDLHGVSENDLKMYYINESDHSINFLDVQGVDTVNNMVWGKTNHFSTYGIVSYSSYMNAWNSGSNPTIPEYTYGDKINIKANVHNTGDAAVNDNVLVYFYAGNPDAGGSYLGSATITGGITQGGAKTAVLYGYTISSSAVDIYVKVDPLNSITEKSESNNRAFKTLSIGPQNFDSDGDGLTDYDETNGMRTSFGNIIKTDPNNRDTDGDGLSDGEEIGTRFLGSYFFNSNPTLVDSDGDGLGDFDERDFGTNALNKDTDNDGILDSLDTDPLIRNVPEPAQGVLEIARDIVVGAVFGESGIQGGSLNWLVGVIASSPYYLVGWIGFSLVPVVGAAADARDAVQAFINGDELGAALNAAGAIPGIGDTAKMSGAIGLFITKYPSKISGIAKALVKYLKYVPHEGLKLGALDAIYSGAATALKKGDIHADDLFKIVENNGDLGKTLGIAKDGAGNVRWLEEGLTKAEADALGKTPTGWRHIFEKHVIDYNNIELNQFAKAFDPTGTNYRSAGSIQNLISNSIKEGKLDSGTGIYYYKVTADKYLKTIPGSNGYIRTSHPVRLEDVPLALR